MSKINMPTTTLSDEDCNILFQSVTEKLHIENPKFLNLKHVHRGKQDILH